MNRIIRLAAAAAVLATTVACGEGGADLTADEAEVIVSESKGLSVHCDTQAAAEYCFASGDAAALEGAGQCLGRALGYPEYVPGACILIDREFEACQWEADFCTIIGGL